MLKAGKEVPVFTQSISKDPAGLRVRANDELWKCSRGG